MSYVEASQIIPKKPAMAVSEDILRFDGLVAPLSASEFLRSIWPGQLYVSHGANPALGPLIEQPELQDIVSFCSMPNKGGIHINFTREDRLRIEFNAEPPRAIEQFRAGNTIQMLDLKSEETRRWAHSLDTVLGLIPGSAVVNAFTSSPGKGIPWHWDAQEVFIVQVRGRKRWHVAPNDYVEWPTVNGMPTDHPSREMTLQLNDPLKPVCAPEKWQVVEMQPGSVMFMPRGYWHRVEQNIDESLHLVLGVRMPNWRDLLRFLLDYVPDLFSLEWRSPTSALRPENLATLAPLEFQERLASLASLANAESIMAIAQQFSALVESGSLYKNIAPEMKY